MWTCPLCGASFVSRNLWHGCTPNTVDAFFVGKPALRTLFDGFVALIERCGPVTVVPTRSRIAIMGRVRFAGLSRVTRDAIVVQFALPAPLAPHVRIERIERYAHEWYGHRVRLKTLADLDEELADWLCASYHLMGHQERFNPGK